MRKSFFRCKRSLGYVWHQFKVKQSIWLVENRNGKAGFVSYGDLDAVKHFALSYLGNTDEVVIQHKWRWGGVREKEMRRMAQQYGLAVTSEHLASPREWKNLPIWPCWLELVVDLPATVEEYRKSLSRSAKSDLRRIRCHELTMKVSRSRDRLEEFYHRFYVPSAEVRHTENAFIYPWEAVLQTLEGSAKSELIEVWHAGVWIGAVLCDTNQEGYHMRRLGWLNGDMAHYKVGVLGALYWYAANRAIESGEKRLLYGQVRPYLEDGLLFFKTKWGGKISYRLSDHRGWRVSVDPSHPSCRAFFDHHSLLLKSDTSGKFNVLSGRSRDEVEQAAAHADQIEVWQRLEELPRS